MVQLGRELSSELVAVGSELLRPLALFAIYQVSKIYVRQRTIIADGRYEDGLRVLLQLLGLFEERWRVAGMYSYLDCIFLLEFRRS
jgi:HEAT repeat protein